MLITLKLQKWDDIDNIIHTATTWQISSNIEFTDILDSKDADTESLDIYYSDITFPLGETYYIRAKRHFDGYQDGPWCNPRAITNTDVGSELLLNFDIKVEKPMVFVNRAQIIDDNIDTFEIATGAFRGEGDGHGSTHWFISDDVGIVKWSSTYNTTDKESILVNKKDLEINDLNTIMFSAVHVTPTGVESALGITKLSLHNFNFEIISNMKKVIPDTDYNLLIRKVNDLLPVGIKRIELLDYSTSKVIWEKTINDDVLNYIIPGEFLKSDSEYIVSFITTTHTNEHTFKRKTLSTIEYVEKSLEDPNFNYSMLLQHVKDADKIGIPKNVSTSEYLGGLIPNVIENSAKLHIFNYDRETNTIDDLNTVMGGVDLITSRTEDTLIKYLSNNTLIIDTYNNMDQPVFMIYKHNPYNNTSVLKNSIVRTDELKCLGFNNSFYMLDEANFIYNPPGINTIKRLNIVTGEIVELGTSPLINVTSSILVDIGRNRMLIIGGDTSLGWSYNLDTKVFEESQRIPTVFRNRPLKVVKLINGDSLILRTTFNAETDTNNNVLYYDLSEETLKELEFDLNVDLELDTTITLKTGEVVSIDSSGAQNKYFEFI